jgi:hypothetical protein
LLDSRSSGFGKGLVLFRRETIPVHQARPFLKDFPNTATAFCDLLTPSAVESSDPKVREFPILGLNQA